MLKTSTIDAIRVVYKLINTDAEAKIMNGCTGTSLHNVSVSDLSVFIEQNRLEHKSESYTILFVGAGLGHEALSLAASLKNIRIKAIELVPELVPICERFSHKLGISDRTCFRAGNGLNLTEYDLVNVDHVWSTAMYLPLYKHLFLVAASSEKDVLLTCFCQFFRSLGMIRAATATNHKESGKLYGSVRNREQKTSYVDLGTCIMQSTRYSRLLTKKMTSEMRQFIMDDNIRERYMYTSSCIEKERRKPGNSHRGSYAQEPLSHMHRRKRRERRAKVASIGN